MSQIIFQTDQSGANTNICATAAASTVTFNFSVSSGYDVYSANIVMKKASGTVDPVVVTIYNQPNGGGSSVGSSTVLASAVTQSFATVTFLFSGVTLAANTSYSLVLSSTTGCSGSFPYSFKAGNFQVLDKTTSTVINTGYGIASALTSVATMSPAARASKVIGAGLLSSASLTSAASKSKAMSLASYVVSTLGAVARMARSAASALHAKATLSSAAAPSPTASVDREAACDMSAATILTSTIHTELTADSAIESRSSMVAEAEVMKHISASHEVQCSISAAANSNRAIEASLGTSLFVEASLSGAKSLFSVFADLEVRSNTNASSSLDNEARVEPVLCESNLAANVALVAAAMSSMGSSCLLLADPRVAGEQGTKKREGSGHYVLNSGVFTLRQWKRFIKASDDKVPKKSGLESRRIDLRAPGLLRR